MTEEHNRMLDLMRMLKVLEPGAIVHLTLKGKGALSLLVNQALMQHIRLLPYEPSCSDIDVVLMTGFSPDTFVVVMHSYLEKVEVVSEVAA